MSIFYWVIINVLFLGTLSIIFEVMRRTNKGKKTIKQYTEDNKKTYIYEANVLIPYAFKMNSDKLLATDAIIEKLWREFPRAHIQFTMNREDVKSIETFEVTSVGTVKL